MGIVHHTGRMRWNSSVVHAVLETQRVENPSTEFQTLFNGFPHAGYIGSHERNEATDRLVAKALHFLGWSPALFVEWACSTRGRYFLDWDPETVEKAVDIMRGDEDDVRRWLAERQRGEV